MKNDAFGKLKHATAMYLACNEVYGSEFENWDPAALRMQLEDDFKDVPRDAVDKIQAAIILRKNDLFHDSVGVFANVCNTLTHGLNNNDNFVPNDLEDLSWGVTEAFLIDGISPDERPFSPNVCRYVALTLADMGIFQPPHSLRWANYPQAMIENNQNALVGDEVLYKQFYDRQNTAVSGVQGYLNARMTELVKEIESLELKQVDKAYLLKLKQRFVKS